jgi:CheY-like chemotaxis protein
MKTWRTFTAWRVKRSDIGLPGQIDGYAVARLLRSTERRSDVYLIALSGYTDVASRQRALDSRSDQGQRGSVWQLTQKRRC